MAEPFPVFDAALARVLQRLAPHSLLDIGCGRGRMGRLAAQALPGSRCTGLDIDRAALDEADAGAAYAELHLADALAWTEEHTQPFDCVLACGVLEHLPPAQGLALLQAWVRRSAWVVVLAPEFAAALPPPVRPGLRLRSVWSERDLHWHDLWAWDNVRACTLLLLRGYEPWPTSLPDLVRASEAEDWPLHDFDGRTPVRPLRLRLVEHAREVAYRPA